MAIRNAQQLEEALMNALEEVSKDRAYIPKAQEIGNLAGKAINQAKARMEYALLKNKLGALAPKIGIMEDK